MISVENALAIIAENARSLAVENCSINNALGSVLAEDVFAKIDLPSFNQSAMDGYAFNFKKGVNEYKVIGEIPAGSSLNPTLNTGEGVRIFTGAMVPTDANIVVQQEWIERNGDSAKITENVSEGRNIRLAGEQIKKGEIALRKGSVISPATIGFLLGLGLTDVAVFKKPKITVIVTGNELVKPGKMLEPGQIYESNSGMIIAAIENYGFLNWEVFTVKDNYQETLNQIQTAIEKSDMLIITGGISVGDYDFVGKALQEIGTTELFYKVKQKPGKPVYIGKKGQTFIAALPGNPAAALSCFYIYVLPLLNRMIGKECVGLSKSKYKLKKAYTKKGDRSLFLKGKIEGDNVAILEAQSSAMLLSFSYADGLIYIPENKQEIEKGELVTVYKL